MTRLPALGFNGEDTYTIDEQGRVALPSKFRRAVTGKTYVITMAPEPCLSVYPEDRWQQYVQALIPMTFAKKVHRDFTRLLGTRTEQVNVDSQGRMKIPERFLHYAALEREALVIGAMDRLEIWNPERWASYKKEFDKPFDQLAEESIGEVQLQDIINTK
jgi:MraZ protein